MIVYVRIMHHSINEGCIRHALLRINNESELNFEPIYILLERLLLVPDNFKETISSLRLLDLQCISLSKMNRKVCELSDTTIRKLLKPCNGSFLEACWEGFAKKSIVLLTERYDLAIILNMYHMIHFSGVDFEVWNGEFLGN